MSCCCYCSLPLAHGAESWYVVCDCVIYWSYLISILFRIIRSSKYMEVDIIYISPKMIYIISLSFKHNFGPVKAPKTFVMVELLKQIMIMSYSLNPVCHKSISN